MYQQSYSITIRDINYANHMDHLSLLNYLHETRIRFLRDIGYDECNVDGFGSSMVVIDLQCNYKIECFYGEIIIVELSIANESLTRLNFLYKVYKSSKLLISESKISVAFLNSERKVIKIPQYLLDIIDSNGKI